MPAKRELTMRQLRYMLRLHHDGVSAREIGRTLGVARSTIQDNLRRRACDRKLFGLVSSVGYPVPVGPRHGTPKLHRSSSCRAMSVGP